jgi:uncharacterized protein YraI
MADMNKLNDQALENVTGGARRTVQNSSADHANVRSGPGQDYGVVYRVYNGDSVYTTGYVKYSGGYDWYELDDGNFIAGSLIGY